MRDKLQLSQFTGMARLSSGRSILWSGLTGFVGIVSSSLAAKLKTGIFDHADESLLALDGEGLFFQGSEGEALVDVLETLAKRASNPTHYRLVLTGCCDLTCSYCIQARIRKTMDSQLSPKVIGDVVRHVEHTSFPGDVEILLMGGEPLYNVHAALTAIRSLCDAFAYSGRNYPNFKILTNGLNLASLVDSLGSLSKRIRDIQVTLDQDKQTHDSVKKDRSGNPTFDRVVRGLKRAVDAGIHITLRMNIHNPEQEVKFLQTCEQLYSEIGAGKLTIYPALVIERPLAVVHHRRNFAAASSSFSRLLVAFFLWHYSKTDQIHPLHVPLPRWIKCHPKLGPPTMLGSRGEVYSCTYSEPTSLSVDTELQNCLESFPLTRDRCKALAQEVWNETCRNCQFLAFCTGVCSVQSAAGQTFSSDCESWTERFRTYGELIETGIGRSSGAFISAYAEEPNRRPH